MLENIVHIVRIVENVEMEMLLRLWKKICVYARCGRSTIRIEDFASK